jgi:mono/diheme cytochrome c family protein
MFVYSGVLRSSADALNSAPQLPQEIKLSPAEEFWVIKHGVKLTAMLAWGQTHSDALIWDMMAFLQFPAKLNPTAYDPLVKSAPSDHDETMCEMK